MADPKQLQAQLKLLSDAYAAQLPEKLKQIETVWHQLPQQDRRLNRTGNFQALSESELAAPPPAPEWDWEIFENLHRMVHSLTGSGKTFGFSLLSDVARKLEQFLKELVQAKEPLNDTQLKRVQELLRELHQVSQHRDASPDEANELAVAPPLYAEDRSRRVFIVEDDPEFAENLKAQLGYFGYEVTIFSSLPDFRLALQQTPDVIVLMDISFPEDSEGGIHVMKEIQQEREIPVPVVFLTAHNQVASRLDAVRAGGIAYLPKPVNVSSLIDKLDALTSTAPPARYRVLIVDDLPALTTFYSMVLEQAGMEVRAINDPFEVLEPLREFAPDLILLDLYMPECNGMELAKVIRQLEEFVSIPIVFLSAESNIDKQLSAISLGGDDFLTKPIAPEHLVSSVRSRIQRSLLLRSFMVRDSLTGLLNHTSIKEQLDREVARSKRLKTPMSFAMVDIDFFKKVNDTYGHPAGDRVIKSLSRLLKQRLRENDMVGRYGGEEFAVVLLDTDGPTAVKVLDAIRHDFSQLHHLADGKEFSSSFSCGVADVSHYHDSGKLCDAADKALYKAKHAGRNQVMLADGQ